MIAWVRERKGGCGSRGTGARRTRGLFFMAAGEGGRGVAGENAQRSAGARHGHAARGQPRRGASLFLPPREERDGASLRFLFIFSSILILVTSRLG